MSTEPIVLGHAMPAVPVRSAVMFTRYVEAVRRWCELTGNVPDDSVAGSRRVKAELRAFERWCGSFGSDRTDGGGG